MYADGLDIKRNHRWSTKIKTNGETLAVYGPLSYAFMTCNEMKNFLLLMWLTVMLPGRVSAAIIVGEEAQTGLRSWEWREAGVSVRLMQRLPDQTRAFFQGRGFSSVDADQIANACVFQTIFRNDGEQSLSYDLDDWRISYQLEHSPLLTRERWDERWRDSTASKAARIALHWSLLPTRQRLEPGDYNWGMTSFGLQPGEPFDLTLVLTLDGNPITRTIPGIVCAADRAGN